MTSPLNKDDYQQLSKGFHNNPARSLSLNADAYTRDDYFKLDQQAVLARIWHWG